MEKILLSQKIERISYSNITTFINCQQKWKLRYIDGHDLKTDSMDTIYGTAMHETIQEFLAVYYSTTVKSLFQDKHALLDKYTGMFMFKLTDLLNKSLKEEHIQEISYPVLEQYLGFGVDLLTEFLPAIGKWFPKRDHQLIGTEIQLKVPIEGINISFYGFIDIVLYNKAQNRYKIIDLKTSRLGWKDRQKKDQTKRLQLLLYKHYYALSKGIDPDSIDIEFLILKKVIFESQYKISRVQVFQPPSSKMTLKKQMANVQKIFEQMQELLSNDFENISYTTNGCSYCQYKDRKDLCNRGRKLKT